MTTSPPPPLPSAANAAIATTAMPTTLELIGAPTDIGASVRGAGMGPDALRVADIAGTLARLGFGVVDAGNLAGPATPWAKPADGLRHLEETVAWNRAVHDAVDAALAAGRLPVMMGGDHCLAVGSISAVARHARQRGQKLRVLWLDAHTDVNTETTSPSGNLHGMPVACLLGHGPAALTGWSGPRAALAPDDIRFLGIRSVDADEKKAIRQLGLTVFDMRHIDEHGMRNTMTDAPGVGTGVRGGPTYREMQLCMEMIADTGRLRSLDVVEVNPALDVRNRTGEVAVELIESMLGKSTLQR
jgi:arginase